ncbi:MAG: HAMP domain-containing sensor histidine kinase [Pseudomonadota bacterium]
MKKHIDSVENDSPANCPKKSLEELENLNTKLDKLVEEKTRQLQDSMRFKSFLMSYLNHEVRKHLNTIVGYSSLVYEDLADDDISTKNNISYILSSSENILKLINDVVEYSRIDKNKDQPFEDYIKIENLIEIEIDIYKNEIIQKGNEISHAKTKDIPIFLGDAKQISKIIGNMIANANKYTKRGKIEIESTEINGEACITFKDTGIGISEDYKNNLFLEKNLFDMNLNLPGTGMQVALAKVFTEAHGGRIEFESVHKKGSTFWVYLPINVDGKIKEKDAR